jgi:nucleoside phosphorylase
LVAVVALGVALSTGTGVAWADESGADKATPSSSEEKTTTSGETAEPQETHAAETPTVKPPKKKKDSQRTATKPIRTRKPASVSNLVEHAATTLADTARKETTAALTPAAVKAPRIAAAESTTLTKPKTAAPKPVQPNVIRAVTAVVSTVVNAILTPLATRSAPGAPAGAPSLWSLLAFARREFERAFTVPSLTERPAATNTTSQPTEQRTLILSAFPAEADAILARTTLDPNPSVIVDGHHFYLGTLGGKNVIVAMTGIGMVNAARTTEIALDHFTGVDAVVFAGVAGGSGRTEIGDVAVPARWTSDDGDTWHAVDPGMLAAASDLDVDLLRRDSVGDPTCFCGLFAGPQIGLGREPDLHVGGDGSSDDNNNGMAFPALPSIPFIGDIFGPQPCAAPDSSLLFTGNLFQAVLPFLAFGLVSNLTGLLNQSAPPMDAVDQETAAAQQVADAHGIPFLGIRGMSDGPGDPLHLPGYPFTFLVYKQIAADNAAIVTEAFLQSWDGTDST